MKTITKKQVNIVKQKLNLNTRSKILNISHKDLDGIGSSIVIKNCFREPIFAQGKYNTIDGVLMDLNFDMFDAVILTDLSPKKETAVELGDNWTNKVLLLDHHDTALDLHDPDNMKFVFTGESGSLLCKKFFTLYYDFDFSHLETLIDAINDYDMWILENPNSEKLNTLYYRYWDERFRERFWKGFSGFTFEENQIFIEREKEFNKIWNELKIVDIPDTKMCFFNNFKFVNELCDKLLKEKNYKVVISRNIKSKNVSIRTTMEDIHIGKILEDFGWGGGHAQAGGFHEPSMIEFSEKMNTFQNKLYDEYPEVRGNI